MAKITANSLADLGGLVFSTDRSLDLSAPQEETVTLPPAAQTLRVRKETAGRKGKVVTIVEGFSGSEEDLENLGRNVKKHCGCGGSVKDSLIIIQGDMTQKIREYLISQGYTRTK